MNKIKLPSNEVILYILALAGALRFAYTFIVMDGGNVTSVAGMFLVSSGIVLGGAAGLAMAKLANALPRIRAKSDKAWATAAFVAFLVVAPVIIAPVTFSQMNAAIVENTAPWFRWIISAAVGVFVDVLTAGLAFTSGKLDADEAAPKQAASEPVATPKQVKPAFVCSICGYVAKSQAALSGHGVKHSGSKAEPSGYTLEIKPMEQTK